MILLPHSIPPRGHRLPWVCLGITLVSALASGWLLAREDPAHVLRAWTFDPEAPRLLPALAAIVLHPSWPQLAMTLPFLVGAGRALEWRIGRAGVLGVYLLGTAAAFATTLAFGRPAVGIAQAGVGAVVGAAAICARAQLYLAYWVLTLFGKVHVGSARYVIFWLAAQLAGLGLGGAFTGTSALELTSGLGAGIVVGAIALIPYFKPEHVRKAERDAAQVIGTPVNAGLAHRRLGPDPRRTDHDWW